MIRLQKKHSANLNSHAPRVDGRTVLRSQSLRQAMLAAIASVLVLNVVWMQSAAVLGRVFPWFVVVQGALIGMAVQRWGRGLDWRFVTVAAVAAIAGAYTGNFILAADTTADEFGTGPLHIVSSISELTLGVYFDEVVSPVDHIFALCAAVIAAFLAKRRLTRAQAHAVRVLQEQESPK